MEAFGLAVGVAGLAGLFSACIECFELIQRGRYLGKDYLLLETKFANQIIRFTSWGRACGLIGSVGYEARLDDEELRPRIEDTLNQILMLFKDGRDLRKRYGLRQDQDICTAAITGPSLNPMINSAWTASGFRQRFQDFTQRLNKTQKQASLKSSTKWAIEDKRKFTDLIQHLKDLVDDLESLTRFSGIVDTQREMIRCEIESISEIATLEAIEEARVGNFDAVSDAASLRLWKLRDRFLNDKVAKDTAQRPRLDQETSAQFFEDYDMICEEGKNDKPEALDSSVKYQIFHRVYCANNETTAIFFDRPDYLSGQHDTNQWEFLGLSYDIEDQDEYHLCGRRRVPSLEGYLKHNSSLQFLVLKDYRCCEGTQITLDEDVLPGEETIRLLSEELCDALRALEGAPSGCELYRLLQKNDEWKRPYPWFYHRRSIIKSCLETVEAGNQVIAPLYEFIRLSMAKEYDEADDQFLRGVVSWASLQFLFLPFEVLVQRHLEKGSDHDRGVEQISWPHWTLKENVTVSIEVDVRFWELAERFQRTETTLKVWFPQISSSGEETDIRSLPIFPLRFARDELKSMLERRGRSIWRCCRRGYVAYSGPSSNSEDFIDGRFVIDAATHRKTLQEPHRSETPVDKLYFLDSELAVSDDPPGENFVFLLPPTVYGYDVQKNEWVELIVSFIQPIIWDKQAFARLVMDAGTKSLISALVTTGAQERDATSTDILRSKSRGLVLLFHGGLGTGKTFAAESIAELVKKPLLRFNLSQAGASANELEKYMRRMLYLGKTWGSVILVDEAEVLLEERTLSDMARNAMVTTMMKLLDQVEGIVILTSNRIGTFDEALRSRIHLSVHFNSIDSKQRERIWLNFINHAISSGKASKDLADHQNIDELARMALNGREIHNMLSSALALASYRGENLNYKTLKEVADQSRKFNNYLALLRGITDGEMAREDRVRDDGVRWEIPTIR